MKLTEKINENHTYLFIKFMPMQYVENFRKGFIYLNNLKTYVEMEKKSKTKGIGDKYEAALVMNLRNIKLLNPDNDELIFDLDKGMGSLTIDQHLLHPVFCSYIVDSTSLEIIKETDKEVQTKIIISQEDLEKVIKDFGETAVVIVAKDFFERFTKVCNEKGYSITADKIKYYDYSINQKERMELFLNNELGRKAFVKSDYFEHQNEHRFILSNEFIEEPISVNIGDITDITTVVDAKEFLEKAVISFEKGTF